LKDEDGGLDKAFIEDIEFVANIEVEFDITIYSGIRKVIYKILEFILKPSSLDVVIIVERIITWMMMILKERHEVDE